MCVPVAAGLETPSREAHVRQGRVAIENAGRGSTPQPQQAGQRVHARPCIVLVQGGLDERLRGISLAGLVARDTPGYAIGGLAGGEDKRSFVKCVAHGCGAPCVIVWTGVWRQTAAMCDF